MKLSIKLDGKPIKKRISSLSLALSIIAISTKNSVRSLIDLRRSFSVENDNSKNSLILQAIICSRMVAIMSWLNFHFSDVLHIGGSLNTLINILLIVRPHSPFCPFLCPWRLTIQTLLSLIKIIDYVVVIILPKGQP
ncbi:hypothetical protein V1478_015253 [Vespula squamosa]|uniref:Uncharacterized protein n=1 Tax=Vespula squamosa TaxID=30214 RepID=A0ABD2A6X3_VESSQ